jgi:hypothetical protein
MAVKDSLPGWTPPEKPPKFTAFINWLGYHITKDWPVLLKAPIAFASIVVLSLIVAWGATWHLAAPLFEEQLKTKQERIDELKDQRDHAESEVKELKIYRGKDAPPLKRQAFILASQIHEYIARCNEKDTRELRYVNIQRYLQRFGQRVLFIRDDLDQNNAQSDTLDAVLRDSALDYHSPVDFETLNN